MGTFASTTEILNLAIANYRLARTAGQASFEEAMKDAFAVYEPTAIKWSPSSVSPVLCEHAQRFLIARQRDNIEKSAFLCPSCGLFTIWIDGERFEFALSLDAQLEAAGRWIERLKEIEEWHG